MLKIKLLSNEESNDLAYLLAKIFISFLALQFV